MHHGDRDATVPFVYEQRLDSILQARGIVHQLYVYAGYGHNEVKLDSIMFKRVRDWYTAHGLLDATSTCVADIGQGSVLGTFFLSRNYPSPFNPTTRIRFSIPEHSHVTLKVFDVLGREVATLVERELNPGEHSVVFNAKSLPSGVYFYRLQADQFVQQRKMGAIR